MASLRERINKLPSTANDSLYFIFEKYWSCNYFMTFIIAIIHNDYFQSLVVIFLSTIIILLIKKRRAIILSVSFLCVSILHNIILCCILWFHIPQYNFTWRLVNIDNIGPYKLILGPMIYIAQILRLMMLYCVLQLRLVS